MLLTNTVQHNLGVFRGTFMLAFKFLISHHTSDILSSQHFSDPVADDWGHALKPWRFVQQLSVSLFWGTTCGFACLTVFIGLWWLKQGNFPITYWTNAARLLCLGNYVNLSDYRSFNTTSRAWHFRCAYRLHCNPSVVRFHPK